MVLLWLGVTSAAHENCRDVSLQIGINPFQINDPRISDKSYQLAIDSLVESESLFIQVYLYRLPQQCLLLGLNIFFLQNVHVWVYL